jgi:hypothetical protein
VDEQLFVDACVAGGDYKGLSFDGESDVTNEAFIQDSVDELAIINAAFGKTFQCGALSLREFHKGES